MALYADEDDDWKCPEHPSRRFNVGVCPSCLIERLSALCPECAALLPCNCCSASFSSSTSSTSFISIPGDSNFADSSSVGSIGRVSSLIDSEQSYRRTRSVTREFVPESKSKSSIWLFFWPRKSRREEIGADSETDLKISTIRRSKSVAAASFLCAGEARPEKGKGWYLPSPMKVFWHSKASAKIVQEQSPLHRS